MDPMWVGYWICLIQHTARGVLYVARKVSLGEYRNGLVTEVVLAVDSAMGPLADRKEQTRK